MQVEDSPVQTILLQLSVVRPQNTWLLHGASSVVRGHIVSAGVQDGDMQSSRSACQAFTLLRVMVNTRYMKLRSRLVRIL